MEQRVNNLEELCELITKQVVEQNKNIIDVNQNLITEIRSLRAAFVKQDEDFEEFKNLLRKIYEQNRQSSMQPGQMIPPPMLPPPVGAGLPTHLPPPPLGLTPTQLGMAQKNNNFPPFMPHVASNSSFSVDQVNQSMVNNLSFQSERTPTVSNLVSNQYNNNNNTSLYSIPSSASALNQQMQQQQQTPSFSNLANNLNKPVVPTNVAPPSADKIFTPPVSSQQQPFSFGPLTTAAASPQKQPSIFAPKVDANNQANAPKFSFASKPSVTSTPQAQPAVSKQPQPLPASSLFNTSPSTSAAAAPANLFSGFKPTVATKLAEASQAPAAAAPFTFGVPSQQQPAAAATSQPAPVFGLNSSSNSKDSLFKAPAPKTFEELSAAQDEEGEGSGNPEEYEPQVDFKPIVKLAEVEVKTGEEDEEVIFKERCKLYRFIMETKEWKEKGAGEMKILKHKATGVFRILMRRDQVLKLCANHKIKPDMKLTEMSPKQFSWFAADFSENEFKNETLCAKFRNPKEATQFKEEFEKAVEASKSLPSPAKGPAPETSKPANPISLFKKEPGSWSCSNCLANNQANLTECACCKTPKVSAEKQNDSGSDEDVTVLSQVTANQVQVQKAKQFGLPDNFYLYENKPPCTGCRGCENEE